MELEFNRGKGIAHLMCDSRDQTAERGKTVGVTELLFELNASLLIEI
jgi:hypothetical protein